MVSQFCHVHCVPNKVHCTSIANVMDRPGHCQSHVRRNRPLYSFHSTLFYISLPNPSSEQNLTNLLFLKCSDCRLHLLHSLITELLSEVGMNLFAPSVSHCHCLLYCPLLHKMELYLITFVFRRTHSTVIIHHYHCELSEIYVGYLHSSESSRLTMSSK